MLFYIKQWMICANNISNIEFQNVLHFLNDMFNERLVYSIRKSAKFVVATILHTAT